MTSKLTFKEKIKSCTSKIKDSYSTPNKRKITNRKIGNVFVGILKYVLMYGLCFIILYPIILQLAVAFRAPEDVNNPVALWIPGEFSTKNFVIAASALKYWTSLKNTFLLSFGVMICQIISTSLAGYAFARLNFKGRNVLFVLAMFTVIVPQTVISLPIQQTLISAKLIGKPFALLLMSILGMGIKSGIFIYIFRQFFRGIPTELEEAAYVDGANAFQVFYKVMLPNAGGAILIVGLLSFVWQWNDYFLTKLFVSGGTSFTTLTYSIQNAIDSLNQALADTGILNLISADIKSNKLFSSMIINTCGILTMVPLLVIYMFVQNMFIEGIERSGIVG